MNMRFTQHTGSRIILILCIILITLAFPFATVRGTDRITTFRRTPYGYDSQTGSFKLESQLTKDGHKLHANGNVCITFDYFIFDAQAGQSLDGQIAPGSTSSKPIRYAILTSPTELNTFQNSACARGNWQAQDFTTPSTISWIAPADGQYALLFFVTGFYGGTLSFSPI